MFQDDMFDEWLDSESKKSLEKFKNNEMLTLEDKMILTLKAQSNHFYHLDQDMKTDMQDLRKDMKTDMQDLRKDMQTDMQDLRKDMDKRFEQVDKRFEQVDRRFDAVILRMDRFMIWSLGLTMTSTFVILGFMYKFMDKIPT